MHAQLDALSTTAGDAQQLDAVAQLVGVGEVLGCQLADALDEGTVELHGHAEGDGGQQRGLVGGVDALDVEGGIGLGIAQALCLGQRHIEADALVTHLGQDEVGGAVDDAGHHLHAVGRKPLAQRLHDGNAAGHGSLEGHHHTGLAGTGEDLVAMHGQQRLVGGDDLLALGNGGQHDITGQRGAAHHLHQHIDGRVVHDVERIAAERNVGAHQRADFLGVTHDDATDLDGAAGAPADLGSVVLQHLEYAAAHGTHAEQPDLDHFHTME